jgi:hypothetical protein
MSRFIAWVRMLRVPYKYLYPAALYFIAIGVYGIKNSLFDVGGRFGRRRREPDAPVAARLIAAVRRLVGRAGCMRGFEGRRDPTVACRGRESAPARGMRPGHGFAS